MADNSNPINPKQIIDFRQLGVSGLRRFSGFVLEDFLSQLQQWQGIDIYREMSWNDPDVGAALFGIRMMCRRVKWRVEPASQQVFDVQAAEFVDTVVNEVERGFNEIIDEILFHELPFGHAPMEITWKRRCGPDQTNPAMKSRYSDGRIGLRKLEIRHPDTIWRWEFDDLGGILGITQLAPPRYLSTFIPIKKMLLFRTTTQKNNPEGFSVLRNAYRPWYMKKNIENIEAIGIERDLAGLPVAHVPPDLLSSKASEEQQALLARIQKMVINIRRDEQEGIVWPMAYDSNNNPLYKLELLSTAGHRQFDVDKTINRYRQQIMMTVFADFLLLGHNSSGNRSIVEKRSDLFCTAVGAFLDGIATVFNSYFIPRLMELNPDIQMSDYPKLKHGDLMSQDLEVLGTYFKNLSMAGMPLWPNFDLQKFLMEAAHAPHPVDPMKIATELEIQPKKVNQPDETKVVLPANPQQVAGYVAPGFDIPDPGVPADQQGQATTMFEPYPIPPDMNGNA